jgi:feruloyl-CoA synthase
VSNSTAVPFRETAFIARDIAIDRRDDGTILMASRVPLDLGQPHLPAYLRHRAQERPDAIWISEQDRTSSEWRTISFAEARRGVDSLTQVLLDLDPPAGSTVVILSANSIEHALLTYASFQAGIPVVPITPALALQPEAAGQLKERLSKINPGIVFVQDAHEYARALDLVGQQCRVIAVSNARLDAGDLAYADLVRTTPTQAVEGAFASINPDAAARLMFTSGSSGSPKASDIVASIASSLGAVPM